MQRSKLSRRIATMLCLVVFATACASDEPVAEETGGTGAATEAETPGTETGSSPAPTEAATDVEVAEVGGDGTLQIGYVFPETGSLAYLGPPQVEATRYAISLMNEAGGVLGNEVPEVIGSDGAGDPAIANQSVDRLLAEGVDAIIGGAASSVSIAIIDKVTGAEIVQCSGSNTGAVFTTYEDDGYYFRTAPSDVLQGPVLADIVIADGYANVAILARSDEYGQGLADAAGAALEEAGATVAVKELYDPRATNFDSVVQAVETTGADSVILIAFEEGAQILQRLIEAGLGPDAIGIYGTDGLRSPDLPGLVAPNDPAVLAGMQGTAPNPGQESFLSDLQAFAPELESSTFAGQVYDCVTLIGLAAEQAGSDDPAEFSDVIVDLTKEGTKCLSFAECKALIEAGEDVDYDGASGELEFIDPGEPGTGTYELYGFTEDGGLETLDIVSASLPQEALEEAADAGTEAAQTEG